MDKTFKYLICVTVGVVVVKLQLYIEFKAKYIGIKYQILYFMQDMFGRE